MTPNWWVHPGKEIEFFSYNQDTHTLILASLWGEVDIKAGLSKDNWAVSFKCVASERVPENALHDTPGWYTGEEIPFTADQLRHAFNRGRTNKRALLMPNELEEKLGGRNRFDAAVQGLFVRKGEFLAIPVAGNGKLPFPTVAIRITKDIQDRVLTLIENRS
jgi:hypothetical protein